MSLGSFLRKPLDALDVIYDFVGGTRASGVVDLSAPITLVHDVADHGGQASVRYVADPLLVATGGTGAAAFSTVTEAEVRTTLGNLGVQVPPQAEFWLCSLGVYITAATEADLARVSAGVLLADSRNFRSSSAAEMFLGTGSIATAAAQVTSGGEIPIWGISNSNERAFGFRARGHLPVRIQTLRLRTQDDGTGAITVRWTPVFAFAPPGVIPWGGP